MNGNLELSSNCRLFMCVRLIAVYALAVSLIKKTMRLLLTLKILVHFRGSCATFKKSGRFRPVIDELTNCSHNSTPILRFHLYKKIHLGYLTHTATLGVLLIVGWLRLQVDSWKFSERNKNRDVVLSLGER